MLITRIVQAEIEQFLDKETLSQKNLKSLEKKLEGILESDPRIGDALEVGDTQNRAKTIERTALKQPDRGT